MKHGILLIAYHNIEHVVRFINKFDDDFRVFIHWDKRSPLSADERNLLMRSGKVAYIGQEHQVNWASFGIVRATLTLCKEALKYENIDYMHLVSDADYLATDVSTIKSFFETHNGINLLDYEKFPVKAWNEGGYDRVKFYHRLEKYNIRVDVNDENKYLGEIAEQREKTQFKPLPPYDLYGGSAWWSLTSDCVKYLVGHEKEITEYFVDTMFPDESFAQTIIMNSLFAATVVNENKRYIYWSKKHGSTPAILDMEDLVPIIKANDFFIRKVDPVISGKLLDALDEAVVDYGDCIQNTWTMAIGELVDKVTALVDSKHEGGLLMGNAGALVFMGEAFRLGIVSQDAVTLVLESVLKEFDSIDYDSYECGRLGIVVGLEHSFKSLTGIYAQNIVDDLDKINLVIVNSVLNYVGEGISAYMYKLCKIYFMARKHGGRLSKIDSSALDVLDKMEVNTPNGTDKVVKNTNNCGLLGWAGIGLEVLSKTYNQENIEWMYLI